MIVMESGCGRDNFLNFPFLIIMSERHASFSFSRFGRRLDQQK